jgi:cytochrome c553
VSRKEVSIFRGLAVAGVAALIISTQAQAQDRADVLDRIKPVGQVAVEGQAAAPAPAAAPAEAAAPAAEAPAVAEAPAPAPAEPAPAAAAPAAADSSEGAQLYVAKGCGACHGPNGRKTIMSVYPKIAGQAAGYINNQMLDIKSGARNNGQAIVMKGIMANVSEEETRIIADWLATQ